MAISTTVISELRAEMDRLRNEANQIENCLRVLEGQSQKNGQIVGPVAYDGENGSFAGRVRAALGQTGKTASSRDVADAMIRNGEAAERNGRPLRTVVAVELFRMSKKSSYGVQKVSKGRYRMENTG